MVQIFVLLILLPAFALEASAVDCTGLPNGHYDVSCKVYVVCFNGVATSVECPVGQVYANSSLGCYDESKVGSPCGLIMDCSKTPDGNYPDVLNGCKSYYTCQGGHYYGHHYCPEGLVFILDLGICSWPDPTKPCR